MHYMLQMLCITAFIKFSVALDISISSVNVSIENKTNNTYTMQNNDLPSEHNTFLSYIPLLLIFGFVLGCLMGHYYYVCWKKFKNKINYWRFRNKRKYIVTPRSILKETNKLWSKCWVNYKRTNIYRLKHKDKNKLTIKYQKNKQKKSIDQDMIEFINHSCNENTDESKNTCGIKHLNPEFTVPTHAQNLERRSSSSSNTSNTYCVITVPAQVHTEENK